MKVLIALDDSPVSSRAAQVAARLFSGLGAEFLVINVATLPVAWMGGAAFGAVVPMTVDTELLEAAQESEADLEARAAAIGVPEPEAVVETGDPVAVICAAAERHDADVIVVGSHDKSALRRLFDPSVAAGVVRDTYRPVLVVSGAPPASSANA